MHSQAGLSLMTCAPTDRPLQNFFISLDSYIVKKPHRNRALYLLCNFVQSQPPHLHLVIQTPLFGNILQSLQKDSSTATIAVGLVALIMLLPYMPSAMVTYLPTLFNIYARLLFWDRDRLFDPEHTEIDVDADAHNGTSWEKSLFNPDYDGSSIPHLVHYFNILYGLYPINFMDYIRKPQRYLRHANNEEDIDVQASEVRDRSESFRQAHLLHPNFYHLTIESEKTDLSRFIKNEADEVLADCHALLTMERTNHGALRNSSPWPGYESSMPTEEFMQGGQENHVRRSSAASDVAPARGAVSPTLQCPLSVKQESGLDQSSLANDSVPSLSLSHQEAELEEDQRVTRSTHSSNPQLQACAPSRSPGTAGQVAQLRQRNLLLQNDLQFEMYIKQQHMTHIGELRRKQVRQAATEAETQNLVMGNRNMRHRLEESKKAEARIKKESDSRRNMAKKWETDLSTRLKTLREEQKKWSSAENLLKQDLETARADCERLRQLVEAAEERRLKAEQDLEAVDISTDELDRLKKEVERLSVSEREYQGKKLTMQSAIDGAAQAEMRAAQMASDMEAREEQLLQTKSFYDAQILDLNTRLSEAVRSDENKPNVEIKSALEGALAASQAKQSE